MPNISFATHPIAGTLFDSAVDLDTEKVLGSAGRPITDAVKVHNSTLPRFMASNEPEALPYKGLSLTQLRHPKGYQVKIYPVEVMVSFWTYQARKGNIHAQALLHAIVQADIEADIKEANGIKVAKAQKEERRVEINEALIAQYQKDRAEFRAKVEATADDRECYLFTAEGEAESARLRQVYYNDLTDLEREVVKERQLDLDDPEWRDSLSDLIEPVTDDKGALKPRFTQPQTVKVS